MLPQIGDNNTKMYHVTSDVVDLVDSSDDSGICSSGSPHQNLRKPVHKDILSISSDS